MKSSLKPHITYHGRNGWVCGVRYNGANMAFESGAMAASSPSKAYKGWAEYRLQRGLRIPFITPRVVAMAGDGKGGRCDWQGRD